MSQQSHETMSTFIGDRTSHLTWPRTTLLRVAAAIVDRLYGWQTRAAERAHLAALSDYLLEDMGLSRLEVEREAAKPFWRR